jgi:hypothetical protein
MTSDHSCRRGPKPSIGPIPTTGAARKLPRINRLSWILALLSALWLLPGQTASAGQLQPEVPQGFTLVSEASGVWLYQKEYQNGNPDYVQVIDLGLGAGIDLLHATIREPRIGRGVYGGDDPRMGFNSLEGYWRQFSSANSTAFCITNGQFFYMLENPTRLPFPLKVDGTVVSDGYGIDQFPDLKLVLQLWDDHVDIQPLSRASLYGSSAPNIVAGLAEEANKRGAQYVPRTFVGVDDLNQDRLYEIVYIFNTMTARQEDAATVLREFGAEKVMMLDGGGSTQLLCQGKSMIDSERLIPQAIGIRSGIEPALSAIPVQNPDWPVLVLGEALSSRIVLKNNGSATWFAGQYRLVVDRSPWGTEESLSILRNIAPGENAHFIWKSDQFNTQGIYPVRLRMARGEAVFPGDPIEYQIVVLPKELLVKRQALNKQIKAWKTDGQTEIGRLVSVWIEGNRAATPAPQPERFDFRDVLWIPLAIFPVALILLVMIRIIRR